MTLPSRDLQVTYDDALELLELAVETRGANHRYPKKLTLSGSGKLEPYYGEQADPLAGYENLTPEQQRDFRESQACHYFATDRDAALIKAVDEGAPMCIVGFVLDRLGITRDDLSEGQNVSAGIESVVYELQLDEHFDEQATNLLAAAQEQQDGGLPWGAAVENAVKLVTGNA